MQSQPQKVLKSLEYITEISKKHSVTTDGTKTNEPVDFWNHPNIKNF